MNEQQQNERVNWLGATLAAQRGNISHLLLRLKGIAAHVGTSLSLHKKFMRLINQVADDREKELDLIKEIEAVEKHHHELKELHLLRHADKKAEEKRKLLLKKEKEETPEDKKDKEEDDDMNMLIWIALWLSELNPFSSRSKPDNPEPTLK
jgi:hypothetical protein